MTPLIGLKNERGSYYKLVNNNSPVLLTEVIALYCLHFALKAERGSYYKLVNNNSLMLFAEVIAVQCLQFIRLFTF